jgi:phosphohistidine phosphatase SixA
MSLQFKCWVAAAALVAMGSVHAQTSEPAKLMQTLQQGGYVLLMRHASSPRQPPASAEANPDNKELERQLDAGGRETSRSMGDALRTLRIPIGAILSSPTYRARETVRFTGLGEPQIFPQLGDGGRSMQPAAVQDNVAWLRGQLAQTVRAGTNTLIVTHQPNIVSALGRDWSDLADGETLIVRPAETPQVIGRVKIEEWRNLAAR